MPEEQPEPVTAATLRAYVGASGADETFVAQCFAQSQQLVSNLVGTRAVPEEVLGRCYLEAGSELFHRRSAPNGIAQFATPEGAAPIRVARDPLIGVYPLLIPYLGGGFA